MSFYKFVTAKAPVNIAVIKYWGKADDKLKIPINDSISSTLGHHLTATTSVEINKEFQEDQLWLNGEFVNLNTQSQAHILLDEIKKLSPYSESILNFKVHIKSFNDFPTAAGLASSAAGYACLAFVFGHAYGVTDLEKLSILARRGSGSACRSLYGGFVRWFKGHDNDSSKAQQIVDENHWDLRVIICVVNDNKKETPSSIGMSNSVRTSTLLQHRADSIVPQRIDAITKAILDKDFETFAQITMQDSNQFHAICQDTYPPIFYLNDTSRQIIKLCTILNTFEGKNIVAYTFDAGPNACIYTTPEFSSLFIMIMDMFFPKTQYSNNTTSSVTSNKLEVRGLELDREYANGIEKYVKELESNGFTKKPDSISYLIHTNIGGGPRLVQESC